jgi:protein-S-isoprenylcysteine O-methyltransferase Ste14
MPAATEFEFRHRFWLIAAIFALAFACYSFDHANSAAGLASLLVNPMAIGDAVRIILAVACVIVAAGVGMRLWGSAYLQGEVVHSARLHSEALVADGPYRHVRNPLYLGTTLLTFGFGFLASRVGWFVLVFGLLLFHYRLIRREEAELIRAQGDRYHAYCARVPRLWPALRPRISAGNIRPWWRQAFLSETFMLSFLAAMIAYALTLRMNVLAALVGCGVGIYLMQNFVLKGRRG